MLGLDWGISGAALAAVIAETVGLIIGLTIAWRVLGGRVDLERAALFDREKLKRMLAINRDIMIRTAALIAAFLFFTAQGARAGDVTLAANAVLYNFTLVGAFFLDGFANAAEQICGQAYGARDRAAFGRAVKLVLLWGFVFGAGASALFFAFGSPLIDLMTASADVRAWRVLSLAGGAGADLRRHGLRIRRHLHRRDLGARHAQSDDRRLCLLSRHLVANFAAWQ